MVKAKIDFEDPLNDDYIEFFDRYNFNDPMAEFLEK